VSAPRRQMTRQPTIVSTRQRIIVITFDSPEDAQAWDELDDATAITTLTERSYARLRAVHRD